LGGFLLCKNRAITGSGFRLHSQANGFAALQVSAAFVKEIKKCVSGCNGERSENKRKAFGRSRERRGGCRRQTDARKKVL